MKKKILVIALAVAMVTPMVANARSTPPLSPPFSRHPPVTTITTDDPTTPTTTAINTLNQAVIELGKAVTVKSLRDVYTAAAAAAAKMTVFTTSDDGVNGKRVDTIEKSAKGKEASDKAIEAANKARPDLKIVNGQVPATAFVNRTQEEITAFITANPDYAAEIAAAAVLAANDETEALARITAMAAAVPNQAAEIALAVAAFAKDGKQTTAFNNAVIAKLTDDQKNKMLTAQNNTMDKFLGQIYSVTNRPQSEATVSREQDITNNIQTSVKDGFLTQNQATALITLMIFHNPTILRPSPS